MEGKISRTTTLIHQGTGVRIDTPLLVPSFSSKGFQIRTDKTSEVQVILKAAGEFITESYLISAYDISYKLIPRPDKLPFRPNVIVLDSGGYEISKSRDMSDVINPVPGKNVWNAKMLGSIHDAWPKEYATILVIHQVVGDSVAVIDIVIWRYATINPHYSKEFGTVCEN